MTEQLKNCPFCGAAAHFSHREAYSVDSSFDYVGCTECEAMMPGEMRSWNSMTREWMDHTAEMTAAWNRRAEVPS